MRPPAGSARVRAALAFSILLPLVPTPAAAQQFVVDDVPVTEPRACQLEAWHGEHASWLLPACHVVPGVELTTGVGFVGNGARVVEYVIQAKYAHIEPAPGTIGVGFVLGFGFGPLDQVTRDGVAGVFGYLPFTAALAGDQVLVHLNIGAQYERAGHAEDDGSHAHDHASHSHHALTWGVRMDLAAPIAADRFTIIGELFGEERGRPEYQLGLRSAIVPERLLIDVSWGGHTARGERGIGWTIGMAWTPPPFY